MGVLDDAIREHLELKRRHGAGEEEIERKQEEALGAPRREPVEPDGEPEPPVPAPPEPALAQDAGDEDLPADAGEEPIAGEAGDEDLSEDGGEEDVLEETPEFLQETPEHDRLWFEQKPPRDFDFDE